jgi:MFS family permease
MAALDIAIVGPALRLSGQDAAWVFSVFVLFNLLGTPILGALADSVGRRPIYLLALGLFTGGSLLTGLSGEYWVLLLGRAVQGFGAGGIFPVASALVWDLFPQSVRGRMLGLLGASFGIAFLVGPAIGGVLLVFGWRWLFLVNVPVGLVALAAAFRILPPPPLSVDRRSGGFDWAGVALLGGILCLGVMAATSISTGQPDGQPNRGAGGAGTWSLLLGSLALVPLLAWVEGRASNPVVQVRLFARRQVWLVAVLAAGAGVTEAALVYLPQLLKASFNTSGSESSFMLLPLVAVMAITSPVAGRSVDRVGARPVLLVGSSLTAAGMILMGIAKLNLPLYYLAAGLVGMGLAALLGAPLRYTMLNEAPAGYKASAQAALTLLIGLGQLAGGVSIGVLVGYQAGAPGYQTIFTAVGIQGLLIIAALLLRGRKQEQVSSTSLQGTQQHSSAREMHA